MQAKQQNAARSPKYSSTTDIPPKTLKKRCQTRETSYTITSSHQHLLIDRFTQDESWVLASVGILWGMYISDIKTIIRSLLSKFPLFHLKLLPVWFSMPLHHLVKSYMNFVGAIGLKIKQTLYSLHV